MTNTYLMLVMFILKADFKTDLNMFEEGQWVIDASVYACRALAFCLKVHIFKKNLLNLMSENLAKIVYWIKDEILGAFIEALSTGSTKVKSV